MSLQDISVIAALFVACLNSTSAIAQQAEPASGQISTVTDPGKVDQTIRKTSLARGEKALATLTYPDYLPLVPRQCDPNGSTYMRVLDSDHLAIVSLMTDGRAVAFRGELSEMPKATVRDVWVDGDGVSILVSDAEAIAESLDRADPNREAHYRESMASRALQFILRFRNDGSYIGKTRLAAPIEVFQFGVYPSGKVLVSGNDALGNASFAIMSAGGEFERYVFPDGEPGMKAHKKRQAPAMVGGARIPSSFKAAFTQIVPTSGGTLSVYRYSSNKILLVQESGAVQGKSLHMPADVVVDRMLPSFGRSWFVVAARINTQGDRLNAPEIAYRVDPETGVADGEFSVRDAGIQVTCVDGDQLTGILRKEGSVKLFRLEPAAYDLNQ